MFTISTADLIMALTTTSISFANLLLSLYIEKERSIWKATGILFAIPLSLCLISAFWNGTVFSFQLHHSALAVLTGYFILGLSFRKKSQNEISPNIAVGLVVISLITFFLLKGAEHFSGMNSIHAGFSIAFAIGNIVVYYRILKIKESRLMWAFILLGTGQFIEVFYGSQNGGLEAIIVIVAYLFFMLTFRQKIYIPLFAKLQEAETKLQDLNMTVNYEVKKRVIEIERHNEHLINISQLDSMTGVLNKQAVLNVIKSFTEKKTAKGFTIILFDIDNFKRINDSKGHLAGDKYLKTVSAIARESCRKIDRVGRYGGDEFIIILPNTNLSEGMYAADRFRQKVQNNETNITVSAGVAHFPEDGNSVKDLIDYADRGLYKSKERGRNVVSHLKSLEELNSLNKFEE